MSALLLHLADRVLNRPLLVTPDKAQVILQVLAGRIGLSAPEASRFEGSSLVEDEPGKLRERPYRVAGGVGIVTIVGSLVNRGAWIGANSGKTSYEGIQYQLKAALADPAVRSIILDLHSPGGEAVGAFETAAIVRQVAAAKRTVAVVNGMAASAAYAIASGANEIVTTETGVSGSIGIVMVHADFSRNLDREGITPTLIFAGSHKVDGNPFEPLSDAVRADLQSETDALYEHFLATVALGRGSRMTAEMARATGARSLIGAAAVKAGLADRVGSFETVLADLQQSAPRLPGRSTSMKGKRMEATLAPAETGISQADHERAVTAAEARGAKAATDRLAAIIGDTSIKGQPARMTAALDLAVKAPAMPAADVVGFVTANLASASAATEILARMDKAAEGVVSSVSSTGTAGEPPKAAATTPDGWAAEWQLSDKLKADYPNAASYVATRKREAARAA